MNNNKILEVVYNSSKNDWKRSDDFSKDSFKYIQDSQLKIEEVSHERFNDPWAKKFPDKNSFLYTYQITFNKQVILTVLLVSLDGARAMLPKPLLGSNKINKYEYHIANIIHNENENNRYLSRCGFELEK